MDSVLQDLRYALRTCARAPGFTAIALFTMAIAIGANATVFSFVNALLLSPPAGVKSPDTLVSIYTADFSSGPYGVSSYPDYESIRSAHIFERLAAYDDQPPTLLRLEDQTERVRTVAVTSDFFDLLGLRMIHGRAISGIDFEEEDNPVAVISERLWRRSFRANASIVGTNVRIDGNPHTLVGVVADPFKGLDLGPASDIWIPLTGHGRTERDSRTLGVVGRLPEGSDPVQAQARLDGLAAQLAASFPATNLGTLARPQDPRPFVALPHTRVPPSFRAQVGTIATVLLAAVALVLLIACANVAALLLSRATVRHREVALRLALGAGRPRLLQQMLTESVLLGLTGGGLGLLVSLWTADVLPSFFPAEQARLLNARIDWRVIGFTALTAIFSGLVFGIAPALQAMKAAPADGLRSGTDRTGDAQAGSRLRKGLVAAQVALSAVLLVSATLLTRSLSNAVAADLGYSTEHAVLSSIELPGTMPNESARAYFDSLVTRVGATPGVASVALAQSVPVAGLSRRGFTIPGYVPRDRESTEFHVNIVSHTFFETMGMKPASGRTFDASDRAGRQVAVINHVLADRYFTGDPVGQIIRDSHGRELEVVGVVRADRRLDLQDPSLPVVFYLLDQQVIPNLMLIAATTGNPALLTDTIRRTMVPVNRDVAVFRTVTLEEHLQEALAGNRLTVALVSTCGLMALSLALVGLYGVVSYTVVRRRREIGVRMALGATPWQVLSLLLKENGSIVVLGLAAGALATLAATRLLGSMLYGVSATDVQTYAVVTIGVGIASLLASIVPASRALRVDPVTALRQD